jgi:hypothetical protein
MLQTRLFHLDGTYVQKRVLPFGYERRAPLLDSWSPHQLSPVHIRSEGILILKFECIYLIFEGRLRIQKRGSSELIHLRANLFLVTKGNNLGKLVLYLNLTTFFFKNKFNKF